MHKKTLVVGASPNPDRYSHEAVVRMKAQGYDVIPIGIRQGTIAGIEILDLKLRPLLKDIHTISIYLSAQNQTEWQGYLLSLKPQRIIFNPGAENDVFKKEAINHNIEAINACNLVMLSVGNF